MENHPCEGCVAKGTWQRMCPVVGRMIGRKVCDSAEHATAELANGWLETERRRLARLRRDELVTSAEAYRGCVPDELLKAIEEAKSEAR